MTDRPMNPDPLAAFKNPNYLPPTVPGQGPTGARRGIDLTSPTSGRLMPTVDTGHHRLSPDQSIAIGIATTVRRSNGGGGARPTSGNRLEGAYPEITPDMYLSEAARLCVDARRPGREHKLVRTARAISALQGPPRKRALADAKRECSEIAAFGGIAESVADSVRKALGF